MEPIIPAYIDVFFVVLTFLLLIMIVFGYRSVLIKSDAAIEQENEKFEDWQYHFYSGFFFLQRFQE